MKLHWTAGLAGILLGLTACDSGGTGPRLCSDDVGAVTVTVSAGTRPTFSWDPACGVALLLVEEQETGRDVWGIRTDEGNWDDHTLANQIRTPIGYPTVPVGITEIQDPLPLVEGQIYQIVLWRVLPPGSSVVCPEVQDGVCRAALETFTP